MTTHTDFTISLCRAVLTKPMQDESERRMLGRSIADTVAVAAAGFASRDIPAVTKAMAKDGGRLNWARTAFAGSHGATFVNAAASHMLDFDDLHMASSAHLSAVILPALFTTPEVRSAETLMTAFRSGYVAAHAIARRLGPSHYRQGWHATGTIGAFAATAARARLVGLDETQLRHAFALAGAQSGGLRINFGTMAKPLHAAFASAAGVRSVELAAGGVTGAEDVFGDGGFIGLYGEDTAEQVTRFDPALHSLMLKLYPCCFAAHRLVAVALQARDAMGNAIRSDDMNFVIRAPAGSLYVLAHDRPRSGQEAIFSAPYPVAVALRDGVPSLDHFTDTAVQRADIQEMLPRIAVEQDESQPSDGKIDTGVVELLVLRRGEILGRFRQSIMPGSIDDTNIDDPLMAKIESCLGSFEHWAGRPFPPVLALRKLGGFEAWLGN